MSLGIWLLKACRVVPYRSRTVSRVRRLPPGNEAVRRSGAVCSAQEWLVRRRPVAAGIGTRACGGTPELAGWAMWVSHHALRSLLDHLPRTRSRIDVHRTWRNTNSRLSSRAAGITSSISSIARPCCLGEPGHLGPVDCPLSKHEPYPGSWAIATRASECKGFFVRAPASCPLVLSRSRRVVSASRGSEKRSVNGSGNAGVVEEASIAGVICMKVSFMKHATAN